MIRKGVMGAGARGRNRRIGSWGPGCGKERVNFRFKIRDSRFTAPASQSCETHHAAWEIPDSKFKIQDAAPEAHGMDDSKVKIPDSKSRTLRPEHLIPNP